MQSVERAVQALRFLVDQGGDVSVSEVARHIGVNRSTASRLLASLARGHLIAQNPATQRYQPGTLSLELGAVFDRNVDLVSQAEEELKRLSEATGHASWLGILSGKEVVVLKTVRGAYPVQFSVEQGRRLPAHAAAMGKALLARKADAEIHALYAEDFGAETALAPASIDSLLEELALTRSTRIGRSRQELFEGINSLAYAVRTGQSRHCVAISISYPTFAVSDETEEPLIAALLSSAHDLGSRVGDQSWK